MKCSHGIPALLLVVGLVAAAEAVLVPCTDRWSVDIWTSPLAPRGDVPVRVMAVLDDGPAEQLVAVGPDDHELPLSATLRGGPPWSVAGRLKAGRGGVYRIAVRRGNEPIACRSIAVGAASRGAPSDGPVVDEWNAHC